MKVQKILHPTDFSASGKSALEVATALARDAHATLLIVHVEEIPLTTGGGEYLYDLPVRDTKALEKQLAQVLPTDSGVPYTHRLLAGHPADEIVQLVEDEGIDLIVMGTHGRRGLTRLLMGSIAEAVVRRAKCPVLTVREGSDVAALTGA
jgi:nucleotide-binding universal stress UspA family protein